MWKEIRVVCFKLIALILPFFILLPLYCRFFPFYYMDEEYAMYRQQYDFVHGSLSGAGEAENTDFRDPEVLIIGDSRAKAAFDPVYLSDKPNKLYNLALGGTTPIEGYYTLKNYLDCHEKPKQVVLSYAPMHLMDVDTLWTRCIYFHTFGRDEFEDLVLNAEELQNTENILIKNYRLEYLMYQLYLPNKYATALKKSAFFTRYPKTTKKYEQMIAGRGHTFYGTADYSDGIDGEAKVSDFQPSDVIIWYMQRIFQLCESEGIDVIVEPAPVNETSYGIITHEFKEHYRAIMNAFSKKNETCEIYTDFYCYSNDNFGDADHLNARGVERFCSEMKQKYQW